MIDDDASLDLNPNLSIRYKRGRYRKKEFRLLKKKEKEFIDGFRHKLSKLHLSASDSAWDTKKNVLI